MAVSRCILKFGGGVPEMMSALKAIFYLIKAWRSKVCTVMGLT